MGRLALITLLVGIASAGMLRSDDRARLEPPVEPPAADSELRHPGSPNLPLAPTEVTPATPERVEEALEFPPEFPLMLPREFGPGPVIHGWIVSETGEPLRGLSVQSTTWRPGGRGCFKPTYRLGRAEVREDGTFDFRVDAEMLRSMPERKGRTPFSIAADGHLSPKIELSPDLWSALQTGVDVRWVEFRMRLAAAIEVRVFDERGRPCDIAEIYHSKDSANDRWDYRGRTERGVWRSAKATPGPGGHWSARLDDFVSARTPLSGSLKAGETAKIDLHLVRRRPATLTVTLGNYRPDLRAELDGEEIRLDGPVTSLATLTGPHNLSISGDAPWTWECASFEIPPEASSHRVEIVLPR